MSKILSRDEFGIEVTKFKKGEEINEGLFQFLKSFFKQDWKDIKSKNTALKNELEKIDKSLDGFTVLKRRNYDACTQYRQAICDFANALLDSKLDRLEKENKELKDEMIRRKKENGDEKPFVASYSIRSLLGKYGCKDEALAEKIQDSADAVEDIVKKFPEIAPWANTFKRSVKNLINDIIISKASENVKDEEEDEEEDEIEMKNEEASKEQEKEIKDLEKERADILTKIGITPLKDIDGTKALTQLKGEFDKLVKPLLSSSGKVESTSENFIPNNPNTIMLNEAHKAFGTLEKMFQSDTNFGFPNIMKTIKDADFGKIASADYKKKDKEDNDAFADRIKKRVINIYFGELNDIYSRIETFSKGDVFKDVPCDAVQSMYAGIALAVGYGLTGDTCKNFFLSEDNMILMTKCSIEKDATVGYSFPLVDEKKPEEGTIFVALLKVLADAKNEKGIFNKKTDAKLLNTFKQNMSTLFEEIKKNAEKLKEEAEKEKEKEAEELKKKEKRRK